MPSCRDHFVPVDLTRISAVSILAGEHRVILQVLAVLEAIAGQCTAHDFPLIDATSTLEVLRTFADHCHHGKEEDILFPVLDELVPGFGPTQVMCAEHVDGRAMIQVMSEAIISGTAANFAVAAYAYVDLLREHIAKEDDILFRMAQAMLSIEQDAAIVAAYVRMEHADLGDGTHLRMLTTADRLAHAYGVPIASEDPQIMNLLTAVCGCASAAGTTHAWNA